MRDRADTVELGSVGGCPHSDHVLNELIDLALDEGPRWLRRTSPAVFFACLALLALSASLREVVVAWYVHWEVAKVRPVLQHLLISLHAVAQHAQSTPSAHP